MSCADLRIKLDEDIPPVSVQACDPHAQIWLVPLIFRPI